MGRIRKIDKKAALVRFSQGGGGGQWLRLEPEQTYEVRILPAVDDMVAPWVQHMEHSVQRGPTSIPWQTAQGVRYGINCLEESLGQDCPICSIQAYLDEKGDGSLSVKARAKGLMNVLVDGQMLLWDAPPSVVTELQKYLSDPDYGEETFQSLTEGRSFSIKRTKGSGRWVYDIKPKPRPSDVSKQVREEDIPDLTQKLWYMPVEDMVETVKKTLGSFVPVDSILKRELRVVEPAVIKPAKKTTKKGRK